MLSKIWDKLNNSIKHYPAWLRAVIVTAVFINTLLLFVVASYGVFFLLKTSWVFLPIVLVGVIWVLFYEAEKNDDRHNARMKELDDAIDENRKNIKKICIKTHD